MRIVQLWKVTQIARRHQEVLSLFGVDTDLKKTIVFFGLNGNYWLHGDLGSGC